jgi:hypothetical protein
MNVIKSTRKYESWLAEHTLLLKDDLRHKHERMCEGPFPLLRATFYRWMQLWPEVCGELRKAPTVLSVGDLHVENFGTWRDVDGRLVWGVNDFDEAYPLPYTHDLVRLAASAILAIHDRNLAVTPADACEAIFDGYSESVRSEGKPYVLEENDTWLRDIAMGELRNPVRFWKKMEDLPPVKAVPASAREALESMLPERGIEYEVAHRVAGLGSLGRQRYVALADWRGGQVAREAKALVPSACYWTGEGKETEILYQAIITQAVRCPDPFVHLRGNWIVRRLAPHCSKIEMSNLPARREELKLLRAMGWETANIHLGTRDRIKELKKDLKKKAKWLYNAAEAMAEMTHKDWERWRKEFGKKGNKKA